MRPGDLTNRPPPAMITARCMAAGQGEAGESWRPCALQCVDSAQAATMLPSKRSSRLQRSARNLTRLQSWWSDLPPAQSLLAKPCSPGLLLSRNG